MIDHAPQNFENSLGHVFRLGNMSQFIEENISKSVFEDLIKYNYKTRLITHTIKCYIFTQSF